MSEAFIELRNIGKQFLGLRALDDVSLTINKGEIHCLAGENGSGKSTLIKIISGVYQPTEGEIFIEGEKVGEPEPHRVGQSFNSGDLSGLLVVR